MESELKAAQEHYLRIAVIDSPEYNVGVIPQFVIYRDGKAIHVAKGTYKVSGELARIRKGTHPILK